MSLGEDHRYINVSLAQSAQLCIEKLWVRLLFEKTILFGQLLLPKLCWSLPENKKWMTECLIFFLNGPFPSSFCLFLVFIYNGATKKGKNSSVTDAGIWTHVLLNISLLLYLTTRPELPPLNAELFSIDTDRIVLLLFTNFSLTPLAILCLGAEGLGLTTVWPDG